MLADDYDRPNHQYRPATAEDIPMLARLAARTFPDACPPELPPEAIASFIGRELSEEAFSRYIADSRYLVGVLDSPGETIAGYVLLVDGVAMDRSCSSLITCRPTIGISKFYLDGTVRGTGAATTLLEAVCDESRQRGARSVWLATNGGNVRARSFYSRHQFTERGGRVFTVGGIDNQDVVYERLLDR